EIANEELLAHGSNYSWPSGMAAVVTLARARSPSSTGRRLDRARAIGTRLEEGPCSLLTKLSIPASRPSATRGTCRAYALPEGQARGTERALGHAPRSEARRRPASATSSSCSCVRCPCRQRLSRSSWRRASRSSWGRAWRQILKQAWKRTWACSWQPAAAVRQRSDVPLRGLARGLVRRLASELAPAPARGRPSGWAPSPPPPCPPPR